VLRRHVAERRERCLAHGFTEPWLFLSTVGTRLRKENTELLMTRLCRRAGLRHFTPHDLRHTFASLLLQRGETPKSVQQLGHSSLALTTDLYGKWLRAQPTRGGVAALDAPALTSLLEVATVGEAEASAGHLRVVSEGPGGGMWV
jgi:integrase